MTVSFFCVSFYGNIKYNAKVQIEECRYGKKEKTAERASGGGSGTIFDRQFYECVAGAVLCQKS